MLLSPVPGQLPPYKVTAYDACGLSNELIDGLGERLGPQITVANGRAGLRAKGLGLGDRPEQTRAIAAAAVAMTGVGTERPLIDFLNPRVGGKKAVSHKRTVVWGAGIAGACVLALGILLLVWHVYAGEVAANAAWLQANSSQIAAAQEFADHYRYVEPWIDRQPRFLECLKRPDGGVPGGAQCVGQEPDSERERHRIDGRLDVEPDELSTTSSTK